MPSTLPRSLQFPLAGIHRRGSHHAQPPYTARDALNVRPDDTIEGRARGGSRPGAGKFHPETDLGGEVRMLAQVDFVAGDGWKLWEDEFDGETLGAVWTTASWLTYSPGVTEGFASLTYNATTGCVRAALSDLDITNDYAISIFIQPWLSAHHGTYRIYARMDDTTPDASDEGIVVELTMTGATGAWTGKLSEYNAGVATNYTFATTGSPTGQADAGWLRCIVSGDDITVYWLGVKVIDAQAVTAHAGKRIGFGMVCSTTSDDNDTMTLIDVFRIQYSIGDVKSQRNMLVASASGNVFYMSATGILTQLSTNLSIASDRYVMAVQRGQKLYIADWGARKADFTDGVTNGTTTFTSAGAGNWTTRSISTYDDVIAITSPAAIAGTYTIATVAAGSLTLGTALAAATSVEFYVMRGAKVFDPAALTLALWTMTSGKGYTPVGCPYLARYRDRLVLAGHDQAPHGWYMTRSGDPLDSSYGDSGMDPARAVYGTTAAAGVPGEPIRAIVAHADDYLVFGLSQSWWVLEGDPAYGGQLNARSQAVGILSAKSWCLAPDGVLIALTDDGLYAHHPSDVREPKSISRERLPQALRDIDTKSVTVMMEFDQRDRGIHIYLAPEDASTTTHWWVDWDLWWEQGVGSMWPVRLPSGSEPFSILSYHSDDPDERRVVLGCRDGYLRVYRDEFETDDGTEIESYVEYGPVRLGRGQDNEGILAQLNGTLARISVQVTWSIRVADSHEGLSGKADHSSGTWKAGYNPTVDPRAAGGSFILRLENAEATRRWAVETVTSRISTSGRQRSF